MICPQVLLKAPDYCLCYNISHCKDHCAFCQRKEELKDAKRDVARRIDPIMWWCDEMFLAGNFGIVNEALANINVDLLTIDEMLTWLTCSRWAEHRLPYRKTFFKKCERRLLNTEGKERAEILVNGLRPDN